MPTYQVLKNLLKKNPDISFDTEKFIVDVYKRQPWARSSTTPRRWTT